jgi:hypothetical protein
VPKVTEQIKANPWKSTFAAIGAVAGIISIIYFAVDVRSWIVTSTDLERAKIEIINEFRDEAASIRVSILRDLESRLEDVEVEMENLTAEGETIPERLRRQAKRLTRRINEISE